MNDLIDINCRITMKANCCIEWEEKEKERQPMQIGHRPLELLTSIVFLVSTSTVSLTVILPFFFFSFLILLTTAVSISLSVCFVLPGQA